MTLYYNVFFVFFFFLMVKAKTLVVEVNNGLDDVNYEIKIEPDLYLLSNKLSDDKEKVDIKLYYECLCPDCKQFDTEQFSPAVEKLNQFLDIHLYPYGNAKTIDNDGKIQFKCQHGPKECYGNKLHACAIDNLKNITTAVLFNSCMMGDTNSLGSDDESADKCAASMSLDSEPIKTCAKGPRGTELLKHYGEESKLAHFDYVPYILINGKVNDGEHFLRDVCNEFKEMPPPCQNEFA